MSYRVRNILTMGHFEHGQLGKLRVHFRTDIASVD